MDAEYFYFSYEKECITFLCHCQYFHTFLCVSTHIPSGFLRVAPSPIPLPRPPELPIRRSNPV